VGHLDFVYSWDIASTIATITASSAELWLIVELWDWMNASIGSIDIFQLLLGLYRRLEQLSPVTYRISPYAKKLWNGWHDCCEEYKLSEPHPSIRM
jgi:hypothetical protein